MYKIAAWISGVLISPVILGLYGTMAAGSGWWFIAALGAGLVLHRLNLFVSCSPEGEIKLLATTWGPFAATVLLLAPRLGATIVLSTAAVVGAGFAFNEILVYWFPNFLAAAILLALVLGLNLAGARVATIAQMFFSAAAVGGLVVLIVIGLLKGAAASTLIRSPAGPIEPIALLLPAVVFIGYELIAYTSEGEQMSRTVDRVLFAAAASVAVWIALSLLFVPVDRLADSHIPHILTARALAGENGRTIMAFVIVAGAAALVNFLFHSVPPMLARMASARLLPNGFSHPAGSKIGMAGIVGLLMALGFAGSTLLDAAIWAAWLLWLLFYAARLTARAIQVRQRTEHPHRSRLTVKNAALAIVMTLVAAALAIGYVERTPLAYMMALFVGVSTLIASLHWWIAPTVKAPRLQVKQSTSSPLKGENP
jgi:L-asparagine transporter-like permease